MGLKKYEIITVGSDKRVRALRSWQVGDRYVNIGDVGGIVYDEKTLSQEGACWLFKGNFGFPGARIGGDSIVDVAETTLSTKGTPNVDILGSSVVVGSKIVFETDLTSADAIVLTADDFEQGGLNYTAGANWEDLKTSSPNMIRTKSPIFAGGVPTILKCGVAGYTIQAFRLDVDGVSLYATGQIETGEGSTLTIGACQYFVIRLSKNPAGATTPADATTAKITFTGTYETKLSIIDSRVEINPATSTGTAVVKPGGFYAITSGAKYPEAVIRNSKMSIIVPASADRSYTILGQIIKSTATLDGASGNVTLAGIYSNIKNLIASGVLSSYEGVNVYNFIQSTDCDNMVVSPTVFPGLVAARTANMPFIFQGCNVPSGIFYHHAQIANTYKNIDFAKAQTDLGKSYFGGTFTLVSSEVEGMYRSFNNDAEAHGYMVESYESVKKSRPASIQSSYGTTIYKDAYFEGLFDFAGTNVFGNTKKHDTQDVSGCKIVNTGATADNMKGNIRVEGNATLTDVSITGSAYFGGNCVVSGVTVEGGAYVKDNAVIVVPAGSAAIRSLKMTENAYAAPASFTLNGHLWLSGNSKFIPVAVASGNGDLFMEDNAVISGSVSVGGSLTMKDNAAVGAGALTVYGDVTVCGSYNQTVNKTWTGKRTITDVNDPEYDNNVKTQYDF
nr:MAG: protein of unknown function DUF4954 [Bacteriophage sp.]